MIRRTMYLEVFHVTQQRFQQTYGFSRFQLAFSVAFSDLRVEKKRKSMLKIDRNPGTPSIIEPKHSIERI